MVKKHEKIKLSFSPKTLKSFKAVSLDVSWIWSCCFGADLYMKFLRVGRERHSTPKSFPFTSLGGRHSSVSPLPVGGQFGRKLRHLNVGQYLPVVQPKTCQQTRDSRLNKWTAGSQLFLLITENMYTYIYMLLSICSWVIMYRLCMHYYVHIYYKHLQTMYITVLYGLYKYDCIFWHPQSPIRPASTRIGIRLWRSASNAGIR